MTVRALDRTLMQGCIERGLRRMWDRTHKYMSDDKIAKRLTGEQWRALEEATLKHGDESIWLFLDETFDITDGNGTEGDE